MGTQTFPRDSRIRRRSEFVRLSGAGQKLHNRYFLVIAARSTVRRSRLGITVTRKVGNAVVRNRIKRQTREFFRRRQADLSVCWDINVIAKRQAAGQDSRKIFAALEDLLSRLEKCQGSC